MKQIDRLRSMNAEELARLLSCEAAEDSYCNDCPLSEKNGVNCTSIASIKAWLESEVKENE